jgi:hypothetical protein
MILRVGPAELLVVLRRSSVWLPAVFLLEALRIGCDSLSTLLLYGERGRAVPIRALLRAHVIAYPIIFLFPAGRAAGEAWKATALAPFTGAPAAAAAATANQALSLFGCFGVSIPCFLAALAAWGFSGLTIAVGVQAITAIAFATGIQLASRARAVSGLIGRFSAAAGRATSSYQDQIQKLPIVPPGPLGAMLLSRAVQLTQLGVLLHAVSASSGRAAGSAAMFLQRALLAEGVNLVGMAAGDVIPGQVGATDAAFSIAAPSLGIAAEAAIAISISMHAVQLTWCAVGAWLPLLGARGGGAHR